MNKDFQGKHVLLLEGYARQCLPFMREFKRLGCELSLLCNSKLDCGYVSRFPDHRILGICNPDRYEESKHFIADLIKSEKFDLVFPLVDFSARILAELKEELSSHAHIYANDLSVFVKAQDKLAVMETCRTIGVPHPRTLSNISSPEDVLSSGLSFPIVIKPRRGYGSRGFHIFLTEADFIRFTTENNLVFPGLVVQECLPPAGKVISDNVFIDKSGRIQSFFLYESRRVFPVKGGTGTLNITFRDDSIHQQCVSLLKSLDLRGAVGVDLMIDPRDGLAKVIEINPRALACARIGFLAGVNQARQVLEDAFDRPITPFTNYQTGVRVRMTQTDFLWFLGSPDRFRTKPSWFSPFHTVDQLFAWDDPLPWFAFTIQGLKRLDKEMEKRS